MKEFVDDNFKFDKKWKKVIQQEENTVRKGEIAHYEHFLLFPLCFQKACFPGVSKGVIVWEWINLLPISSWYPQIFKSWGCRGYTEQPVQKSSGKINPLPNGKILD